MKSKRLEELISIIMDSEMLYELSSREKHDLVNDLIWKEIFNINLNSSTGTA
jgi:hypothetical protein